MKMAKRLVSILCVIILYLSFSGCASSKSNLELTYDACCDWATSWLANESDILKSSIKCSPYIDGESVTYSHNEIIMLEEYPEKEFACRVYKVVGKMTYVGPVGIEISPIFVMYDYHYVDTYDFLEPTLKAATNHGIDDFDYVVMERFAGVDISETY